ncbi:MAG: TonB-dependent receptor, partial [Candidatus Acidiferrales bacterium]
LYTRSWFQSPNSYDAQFHPCNPTDTCNLAGTNSVNPVTGAPLSPSDQRSQIKTFNIAPTYTHLFGTTAVLTFGAFARRDDYNYYPSADPFSDFSTLLQSSSASQERTLLNAGAHVDLSYVKGANNIKAGIVFEHTFLTENDTIGIVDPLYLGPGSCPDSTNPACLADLTQGGSPFTFHGHTDIKEVALFVEDSITKGNWSFNLGLRGDIYRGISSGTQPEPRVGVAYNIKPTNTVLRVSYARTMETPFNENLIVASTGDAQGVFASILGAPGPVPPGQRNEFHAGFEQAFGKYLVLDADYMWKYTHNSYDFSVLFNTPITYPIAWERSKIHGASFRVTMPNYHGISAFFTATTVAARFFDPQVGGLGTDPTGVGAFRIDHDQVFQQTTHIQYQPRPDWPWIGFNWRYDSGLVAGAIPFATDTTTPVDLTGLSPDQQVQAGLTCNGVAATLSVPLTTCAPSEYGSTRVVIPAPGTESDDHNPPRIAPRNLFDLSIGDDNLFHADRYKWSLQLTAVNLTNKVALYNFLSTFSGTHFVTPRTLTAELGFHF